jgi:signal transduction histidine kinase/ketosteroid isomerase-like protein
MTTSRPYTTDLVKVVEEYHRRFNERDFDGWVDLLHPDVEIAIDSFCLQGTAAARAYAEDIERTYPGVISVQRRLVATSEDSVVIEGQLVNPNAQNGDDEWRLDGRLCLIFDFRDGLIARIGNYYAPSPDDRTGQANVPSRAEAARIAEEQAALRRVATLVARGVPQTELFVSVCREAAQLFGVEAVNLGRFGSDATATNVGGWSTDGEAAPIGLHVSLEGDSVTAEVYRSGNAARVDDYTHEAGEVASLLRGLGIRSSVGVPVVVNGKRWGVMVASANGSAALPAETESRMAAFSELVATAIANSEARAEAARLAEEQAALRRVATLVAHEEDPSEVFAAVARELGHLLGVDDAMVFRYAEDANVLLVASWGELADAFPAGRELVLDGESVVGMVRATGRPARIDDYTGAKGPLAALGRDLGLGSGVGAPIVVHGRLWGVLAVNSLRPRVLPPDTAERIAQFADLTGSAIGNVDARGELARSRARVVAAADGERRRVVRDLHDGAQQAPVHVVVMLKLAQRGLQSSDPEAPALVDRALDQATRATAELLELSHGILPVVLTRDGLSAAVQTLAARAPLNVAIDAEVGRLPGAVEATAYFIVAEGLTNIAKYAHAGRAWVSLRVADGKLHVQVRDDGIGGATTDGNGLLGLRDRVATLSGTLSFVSPPGEGTTLSAAIPL